MIWRLYSFRNRSFMILFSIKVLNILLKISSTCFMILILILIYFVVLVLFMSTFLLLHNNLFIDRCLNLNWAFFDWLFKGFGRRMDLNLFLSNSNVLFLLDRSRLELDWLLSNSNVLFLFGSILNFSLFLIYWCSF